MSLFGHTLIADVVVIITLRTLLTKIFHLMPILPSTSNDIKILWVVVVMFGRKLKMRKPISRTIMNFSWYLREYKHFKGNEDRVNNVKIKKKIIKFN